MNSLLRIFIHGIVYVAAVIIFFRYYELDLPSYLFGCGLIIGSQLINGAFQALQERKDLDNDYD